MKTKLAFLLSVLLALSLAPAGAAVRYVNLANPSPTPPYTTWASAATKIQDAIDAANAGEEIVVTNGVYATGQRDGNGVNRVAVTKPVTIRSLNGPKVTIIDGGGSVRCVYLDNSTARLSGFTLTNGAADPGAGVWCASSSTVVSNCVLTRNSALNFGGGAYQGTLNNCTLTGNSIYWRGGGAYGSTLNNCTLTGNSASIGGGAYQGTLNNCTLTGNSASYGGGASEGTLNNCIVYHNIGGNYSGGIFNYSCTTPLPRSGVGNITDEPRLADSSHLSETSPCRGRGNPAYATGVDIDGQPWAFLPSIGCDEVRPITGPITVAIQASCLVVPAGSAVNLTPQIGGGVNAIRWDFGDVKGS